MDRKQQLVKWRGTREVQRQGKLKKTRSGPPLSSRCRIFRRILGAGDEKNKIVKKAVINMNIEEPIQPDGHLVYAFSLSCVCGEQFVMRRKPYMDNWR